MAFVPPPDEAEADCDTLCFSFPDGLYSLRCALYTLNHASRTRPTKEADGDHLAQPEYGDPVGHLEDVRHIMADENHGDTRVADAPNEI